MESGIPNSFIPKDASVANVSARHYESGGMAELLSLISVVLVIASAALAGGAFLYNQYLTSQGSSKLSQIQEAQAAFDPALIRTLTRLNDRMDAAQSLLSAHVSPTAFFYTLNQTTLTTVSFTGLDLQTSDPKHMIVKMQGVAQSVNSIALQADLFGKGAMLVNPIFSNIDRQSDGVHFDLIATLNPAALNYSQLLATGALNGPAQSGEVAPSATDATTSNGAATNAGTTSPASTSNGSQKAGVTPPPVPKSSGQ